MTEPTTPYNTDKDPAAVLLEQALAIVTGARRKSYGNPEDNFACIGELWTAYIQRITALRGNSSLSAGDVAVMMILMKCARLAENPSHADSWRDAAGYAGCGARATNADLGKGIA